MTDKGKAMTLFEELTRTKAPAITAEKRIVINANLFGLVEEAENDEDLAMLEQEIAGVKAYLTELGLATRKQISDKLALSYVRGGHVLQVMEQRNLIQKVPILPQGHCWKLNGHTLTTVQMKRRLLENP